MCPLLPYHVKLTTALIVFAMESVDQGRMFPGRRQQRPSVRRGPQPVREGRDPAGAGWSEEGSQEGRRRRDDGGSLGVLRRSVRLKATLLKPEVQANRCPLLQARGSPAVYLPSLARRHPNRCICSFCTPRVSSLTRFSAEQRLAWVAGYSWHGVSRERE